MNDEQAKARAGTSGNTTQTGFLLSTIPSRSRLYHLAPRRVGTSESECLTSYIHRLAWAYRVSPRVLMEQEIFPQLNATHYTESYYQKTLNFGRTEAMVINGTGIVATDWTQALERLTMRSDLRHLTIRLWADGLSTLSLLCTYPRWCPVCYQEWQQLGTPIYQPLQWMLQIITICTKHRRTLEERCSQVHCHKVQSVFAVKTPPGFCTQCSAWLGTKSEVWRNNEIDDETFAWQEWVVGILEEFHAATLFSEPLSWNTFPAGLASCAEVVGSLTELARMVNTSPATLNRWSHRQQAPSLERVLALCYVAGISPLQLLTADPLTLKKAIQARPMDRQSRPLRPTYPRMDRERAQEIFQAVMNGQEKPVGVRSIARRVGCSVATLMTQFPQECAEVVRLYRTDGSERRAQRIAQTRDTVRQIALRLHDQGIYPRYERVRKLLPDPNVMSRPEARQAWHDVLHELGPEE